MVENQPQPEQEPQDSVVPKKRRIFRSILLSVLFSLIFLLSVLALLFSTNQGSKFLLDQVLERQQIIQYEYEGGNLWRGIILKNVLVSLKPVDVKIDRADVKLGWRAIVKKEIHLTEADVLNLQIINKRPSTGEPFKFNAIRLPFILRVDHLLLDHLVIKTQTNAVDFYNIELNEALWSGTELNFEDSRMDMGYLSVREATGKMQFEGKYPLDATGIVNLPSLRDSLNIHDIQVRARGTLDTIQAGVATNTPDLLTGWVIVHPMRPQVPMRGELKFKDYHWPILAEQKLFTKDGIAEFNGDIKRLNLNVQTDLIGENIPQGQYSAVMYTDLVNQLNITDLNGQLMKGAVSLAGTVGWKDRVSWDLAGRLNGIDPKHERIPQVVQDFLPPSLDANIASAGNLENGLHLTGLVDFDRYESWKLKLDQNPVKDNKAQPMLLDVAWKNIDRAVPYVGWLSSESGDVKLALVEGQQNIHVATKVEQHEEGLLPAGMYQAKLNLNKNILNVPSFNYSANAAGSLSGNARIELPQEKRQLKWTAVLNAKNLNTQSIAAASPVDRLNGQVKANGYAQPNQQIIKLNSVDLTGRLAEQNETVRLTGNSTIALLFHNEKAGGGFKGYAVNYDGALNASQLKASQGMLKLRVSGTPELLKINELRHDGVAGKINASGLVNLANGIGWDINASLIRFKPQYFNAKLKGELSGNVQTQGVWSDTLKRIQIQRLNL
ncbi:MAG: translocation/assembly module TamB domain-containing protein, partial [Gammaproteobacteria bacterium]